jgi:cobalamin biosynthesis protein CobT
MLREHPNTSDFIVDLVDLIEFDLLRLRVGQRASSADIVTRLKTIELSCGSDQQYCIRKTTRDISRTPIDLCDKVHISFSKEMEAKYTKDVGPSLRPVPSDNTVQNSAEDDRSRTEEGDSEGAQQAENPGDRAKTNEASGTAGSNAQADQPGEHHRQQQQRLNTSNKVTLWIKKLFCFRS